MIVPLADYRRITHDYTSYDGDVAQAIIDASLEFAARTGRIIGLGTYTELLPVYENGAVYPSATPIVSVSDPDGADFDEISIAIWPDWNTFGGFNPQINYGPVGSYGGWGAGGEAGYGAYGYGYDAPGVLTGMDRRPSSMKLAVTYQGGYSTPPPDVVRCICEMATYGLNPSFDSGIPAGTKSVTLGDQSITGSFGASTQFPASVTNVISAYTRVDP